MVAVYEPQAYREWVERAEFEGIVRADLADRGFRAQLVVDDTGVYYPPLVGRPLKVYVILTGQMSIWVNRDYFLCEAGTRLLVPQGALHWSRSGADGVTFIVGEHHADTRPKEMDETAIPA